MIDNIEALELVVKNRNDQLKKITHTFEITVAEWRILKNIMDNATTLEELSELTQLDASTLSRQIKKIVTKKLIKKNPSETDHRKYQYAMTDAGRIVFDKVSNLITAVDKELFKSWTEEEKGMLKILLNRILHNQQAPIFSPTNEH
ncbi:MarR family transcriptional regulator [Pediococcus argentinicus]|uniref:MarR family winged helix-turn-helix transcriptional regulator n=1 Tax=Pediococcus argentinicus TaxID=480391 RepID=UPI00338EBF7B